MTIASRANGGHGRKRATGRKGQLSRSLRSFAAIALHRSSFISHPSSPVLHPDSPPLYTILNSCQLTSLFLLAPSPQPLAPQRFTAPETVCAARREIRPRKRIRRRKPLLAHNLGKSACDRGFERQSRGTEIISACAADHPLAAGAEDGERRGCRESVGPLGRKMPRARNCGLRAADGCSRAAPFAGLTVGPSARTRRGADVGAHRAVSARAPKGRQSPQRRAQPW